MQDLVNEQLTIYGIEIYYLPRKVFKTDNIIKEVQSSKFDDSFILEAYLNNYEGYNPNSDLMTKFGLRLTNEVSLTISKERFEEFIAPFLEGMSSGIKDGTITEGMIPKINTCLDSINNGVTAVAIIDGRKKHSALYEIFSDKGSGTLIRK